MNFNRAAYQKFVERRIPYYRCRWRTPNVCWIAKSICNIGIKHDFLCINICWALSSRRAQHVSEKPVWSLLLYKNIFSLENWSKMPRKRLFSCTYNGAERHVTCERFRNAASRAKTNVMLTSRNYVCYCARYWWWCQHVILIGMNEVD